MSRLFTKAATLQIYPLTRTCEAKILNEDIAAKLGVSSHVIDSQHYLITATESFTDSKHIGCAVP